MNCLPLQNWLLLSKNSTTVSVSPFFWGGVGGGGGGGGGAAGIKVVLFKFLEPLLYSGMSLKLSDLIFVKVRKQALVAIPYTLSIRAPYLHVLTLTFPKI